MAYVKSLLCHAHSCGRSCVNSQVSEVWCQKSLIKCLMPNILCLVFKFYISVSFPWMSTLMLFWLTGLVVLLCLVVYRVHNFLIFSCSILLVEMLTIWVYFLANFKLYWFYAPLSYHLAVNRYKGLLAKGSGLFLSTCFHCMLLLMLLTFS